MQSVLLVHRNLILIRFNFRDSIINILPQEFPCVISKRSLLIPISTVSIFIPVMLIWKLCFLNRGARVTLCFAVPLYRPRAKKPSIPTSEVILQVMGKMKNMKRNCCGPSCTACHWLTLGNYSVFVLCHKPTRNDSVYFTFCWPCII